MANAAFGTLRPGSTYDPDLLRGWGKRTANWEFSAGVQHELAPRVAVYTHKDVAQFLRNLAGERIHRVEAVEIHAIDRPFIALVAARLERRMAFSLSIHERELYLSIGADTVSGAVVRHAINA